jgi:pimeloyl-ACP methyl ester carboxylesterase
MPSADSKGVRIRWEEAGEGAPVLLIMGLGYTRDMWHRVTPLLAERFRVISFDNRGVGQSDVPEGPYTVARMAADAVAVLDAAGVDTAHVIGVSLGGMIAQEVAIAHPERVRSLVLCATTAGGAVHVPPAQEVLAVLQARATMGREEGVRAMVPYVYDPSTPPERIEEDLAIRLRTYPSTEGYTAQLLAATAHDAAARIGALRMPTLVVHGETDGLIPAENGRILARVIPGARLVMLPDTSHILFTDRTEESMRAIVEFLEAAPAEART